MSVALVEELNPEHEAQLLEQSAPGAVQLLLDLERSGALTPRVLNLPPDIDYDRYESLGAFLGEIKSRVNFYLGDWLIFGEGTFAERFAQASEATGLAESTLLRIASVCSRVVPSRRNSCSWMVHTAVASLAAREQRTWLRRAEEHGWGYRELHAELKKAEPAAAESQPLFDGGAVGEPQTDLLIDAARALVRNAEVAGENVIVRIEDYRRVQAALGEEER